ncbi:hypothetical protein [Paenibacillus sp. BIC5C1]|uniref:hypothetical protein n=1 Tax=Paenibacillus sp. BIC5C1 TaxID=3078263 RepID=UPI0028E79B9B|nr:hypothetical protein [Paenibacillus sp. BIC5C1]
MALRNDIMKIAILVILIFLLVKYPEQMGKFLSVVLVGFAEILAKQFIGSMSF